MSYTPNLEKLSVNSTGKVASAVQADSASTATTATTATTASTVADGSITVNKLANGAVSPAKLGTNSKNSIAFSTGSNVNISVTTTGNRPVLLVVLRPNGVQVVSNIGYADPTSIIFRRNSVLISEPYAGHTQSFGLSIPASCYWYLDFPPAGTHTYNAQWPGSNGGDLPTGHVFYAVEL